LQEKVDSVIEQLLCRVGILSNDLYLLAIFDASECTSGASWGEYTLQNSVSFWSRAAGVGCPYVAVIWSNISLGSINGFHLARAGLFDTLNALFTPLLRQLKTARCIF
jgi:hypothetical protein